MMVDRRFGIIRRAPFGALHVLALCACVMLAGCRSEPPESPLGKVEQFSQVEAWALPVVGEAAHPDLIATPKGGLMLSWVQPASDGGRELRIAQLEPGRSDSRDVWSEATTVASGDDWFLNWADTPHIYVLPNGSMWAHWLRKSGPEPMDYGIELVRSIDTGLTWSTPALVNLPGLPGDHGFVTFWPQSEGELGLAWLDSRQKAQAQAQAELSLSRVSDPHGAAQRDGHAHDGGAAMMLRAAVYNSSGLKLNDWPVDVSTCDCCTTASAMTARGPVVVYRGRSVGEIRDTRLVRLEGEAWTAPRDVHVDGWHFGGCPVNGPVVAAEGETVWVGWYTEADGQPEVRIARSDDSGDNFGPPLTVAHGPNLLGRLGMALADGHVLVSWLEEEEGGTGQRLMLSRTDRRLENLRSIPVATLAARGRASGFPRLVVRNGAAWLVWVDVADGRPMLKGAAVH